jgi:hypothetical protein
MKQLIKGIVSRFHQASYDEPARYSRGIAPRPAPKR